MSIASALLSPVKNIVETFGRPATLVHRSVGGAGEFDAETGRPAKALVKSVVRVVPDMGSNVEHSQPTKDGTGAAGGFQYAKTVAVAAKGLAYAPATGDTLEFPVTGKKPTVWQVIRVGETESEGTVIVYTLDIRR